jgi:hypothetical protein
MQQLFFSIFHSRLFFIGSFFFLSNNTSASCPVHELCALVFVCGIFVSVAAAGEIDWKGNEKKEALQTWKHLFHAL